MLPPMTTDRWEFSSAQEWDGIEVWIYDNPNYIVILFHRNSQTYVLCNSYNSILIDITEVCYRLVDESQRVWLKKIVLTTPDNVQIKRVKTLSEVKEILNHQITLALL